MNGDQLQHYGVKGMRWGVRKENRKDIRAENKKAFEIGKKATIYGKALNYGTKKTIKLEKKIDKAYEKDPSGNSKKLQKLTKEWNSNAKALRDIGQAYGSEHSKAQEHINQLIDKYGKENVKPINYKKYSNERMGDYNLVNEKVIKGHQYVTSILSEIAYILSPYGGIIVVPKNAYGRGKDVYKSRKRYYDKNN